MADAKEPVVVEGKPVATANKVRTATFRLKDGKRHTHAGQALRAGDEVELNESQAKAFGDKFEAVENPPKYRVLTQEEHDAKVAKLVDRDADHQGSGPLSGKSGREVTLTQAELAEQEAKARAAAVKGDNVNPASTK